MKKIYENEILDYSDFQGLCLIGIKFIKCSIRFCNFTHTDLSYANFELCDIYCSNFNYAVLYTTRFISCDATKAIFAESYLNGIRISESVVTYTEFGFSFNTHKERKPVKSYDEEDKFVVIKLGDRLPGSIEEVEKNYEGIYCLTSNTIIVFKDTNSEKRRVWRRKGEISKVIQRVLSENGYDDKSLDYYFQSRRFSRKASSRGLYRFWDYVWGQLFWGYGVKVTNPVIGFFVNALWFSGIYSVLPLFCSSCGIKKGTDIITVFTKNGFDLSNYLEILYSSILISSLSVFGDVSVSGAAKVFVVLHVLISILSVGLGITALANRMAKI
nr:pentapeptide repeat-containing protein [uncultured Draconibacterium sp.]